MKTKKYILLVMTIGLTSIANASIEASINAPEQNKIGSTIQCKAECVRLPSKVEVPEEEATYEWSISNTGDFNLNPPNGSKATVKRVKKNGKEICDVYCKITVDGEFDSAEKSLIILGWE